MGRIVETPPEFSGFPRIEDKTKTSYITLVMSRPHKWADLLCKPFVLGGLGVPGRGDKIRSGYITPAFSRAHK